MHWIFFARCVSHMFELWKPHIRVLCGDLSENSDFLCWKSDSLNTARIFRVSYCNHLAFDHSQLAQGGAVPRAVQALPANELQILLLWDVPGFAWQNFYFFFFPFFLAPSEGKQLLSVFVINGGSCTSRQCPSRFWRFIQTVLEFLAIPSGGGSQTLLESLADFDVALVVVLPLALCWQ